MSTTITLVTAPRAPNFLNPQKDNKRNIINSNKKHTINPSKNVVTILLITKDGSLIAISQSSFVPIQKLNNRSMKRKATTKERIEGNLFETLFCAAILITNYKSIYLYSFILPHHMYDISRERITNSLF